MSIKTRSIHHPINWEDVFKRLEGLWNVMQRNHHNPSIWGMPRGGTIVAGLLAAKYGDFTNLVSSPDRCSYIIEDVLDTGRTYEKLLKHYDAEILYLVNKPLERIQSWVVFPWEVAEKEGEVREESTAHELRAWEPRSPHYHMDTEIPCFCKVVKPRTP